MATRVHWVYVVQGAPMFDALARNYLLAALLTRAQETLTSVSARNRVEREARALTPNWRKAIPLLLQMGESLGLVSNIKSFHVRKRLRRKKHPIYAWRNL